MRREGAMTAGCWDHWRAKAAISSWGAATGKARSYNPCRRSNRDSVVTAVTAAGSSKCDFWLQQTRASVPAQNLASSNTRWLWFCWRRLAGCSKCGHSFQHLRDAVPANHLLVPTFFPRCVFLAGDEVGAWLFLLELEARSATTVGAFCCNHRRAQSCNGER